VGSDVGNVTEDGAHQDGGGAELTYLGCPEFAGEEAPG
jgi:hypothetical protein